MERACAVVVAETGRELRLDDLRTYLTEQGVAKQFWPERLVAVSALPKTPSGKIQKAALREQMRSGAPRSGTRHEDVASFPT